MHISFLPIIQVQGLGATSAHVVMCGSSDNFDGIRRLGGIIVLLYCYKVGMSLCLYFIGIKWERHITIVRAILYDVLLV